MAKTKVSKIRISSVAGIFMSPLTSGEFPVYCDEGQFFLDPPEHLIPLFPSANIGLRNKSRKLSDGRYKILVGTSIGNLESLLCQAMKDYIAADIKEEQIISYTLNFNSKKLNGHNHKDSISFANTPAISLRWDKYWLATLPNGEQRIMSHKFKGYANICSYKFDTPIAKYGEKWMIHTPERELFFQKLDGSLEGLIEKIVEFMGGDVKMLEERIDNQKLLM